MLLNTSMITGVKRAEMVGEDMACGEVSGERAGVGGDRERERRDGDDGGRDALVGEDTGEDEKKEASRSNENDEGNEGERGRALGGESGGVLVYCGGESRCCVCVE